MERSSSIKMGQLVRHRSTAGTNRLPPFGYEAQYCEQTNSYFAELELELFGLPESRGNSL